MAPIALYLEKARKFRRDGSSTPMLARLQFAFFNRFHLSENTFMIIMAVVIGLLAGLGNYAFRQTIEFFHWLVFEQR